MPGKRKAQTWRGIGGAGLVSVLLGIFPAFALIGVFMLYPIFQALRLSFSTWGGIGPIKWAGLKNYTQILGEVETYRTLLTTVIYAGASSAGTVIVAALLAAGVSAGVRGSRIYRVIWFLPGMAPGAAAAIFWANSFQPQYGAINVILGALGLGSSHTWLAQPEMALWPIVVVTIWTGVGFAFLVLLGAMEQVPVSLYEASQMDGASPARQFFTLTLPLVQPTLVTVALLEFIWTFNGFTIVWAMTQGGPGNATATLPVMVYKMAFHFTRFGPATALAVIGGAFLLALGMIGLRNSRSRQ